MMNLGIDQRSGVNEIQTKLPMPLYIRPPWLNILEKAFRRNKIEMQGDISKLFYYMNAQSSVFLNKEKRKVLSYGDIIKTNDFKVLSKVFKIDKKLSVVKVSK